MATVITLGDGGSPADGVDVGISCYRYRCLLPHSQFSFCLCICIEGNTDTTVVIVRKGDVLGAVLMSLPARLSMSLLLLSLSTLE